MKYYIFLLVTITSFGALSCQSGSVEQTNVNKIAPKAEVLKVGDVVKAFQAANMPLNQLEFFNVASDPDILLGKPNQYDGKAIWQTKKDMGHSIESFATDADLQARKKFYETDKKFSGDFLYTHKNILVRIHKGMVPETAAKFERTVKTL